MRKVLLVLAAVAFTCGCAHSQVPPTQHTVSLTWNKTTSGGTSPYKYVLSRYTMTSSDVGCPAANTTTPNYTPLNSASPVSALTYVDTSAAGLQVCYIAQAQDSATPVATSLPSNIAGPFTVPTIPTAPVTLGGNVTAKLDKPQPLLPKPEENIPVVAFLEGKVR